MLCAIALPKLCFAFGSGTANKVIAHSDIIDEALFTGDRVFLFIEDLPLCFCGMFAVWILCYFIKRELTGVEVIYLCAVVMSIFMITARLYPYWCILIVPYIVLLLVLNPVRIKENLLLEVVLSVGYVFYMGIHYYWVISMELIEWMLNPNYQFSYHTKESYNWGIVGMERLIAVLSTKIGISENHIANIFAALFVTGTVVFLWFNYPKRIIQSETYIGKTSGFRKAMFWRFLFAIFVGCLPIIGLLLYICPYDFSTLWEGIPLP